MAYVFADGFDSYGTLSDVSSRWPSIAGTASFNSLVGDTNTPFGTGQAMSLVFYNAVMTTTWTSADATICGTMRFNMNGCDGNHGLALNLMDPSSNNGQIALVLRGDGRIELRSGLNSNDPMNGGTLLATSSAVFSASGWNSIQFKLVISDSVGEAHVRMNGGTTEVMTKTNINTRGGSTNNFVSRLSIYSSQNYTVSGCMYIDDIFLCSGTGPVPNDWLPELRCIQQLPVSSTQTQFVATGAASNWQAVGNARSDGDTSYVSGSVAGTEDRYGLSAIPANAIVMGVGYYATWRKSDAGGVSGVLTLNGVTIGSNSAIAASYSTFSAFRTLDEAGAAFTPAGVNAAVLGVKIGA